MVRKLTESTYSFHGVLKRVLIEVHQIKANIHNVTRTLREKGFYREEILILVTAIYISCPFLNKRVTEQIIIGSLNRKVEFDQIAWLQRDIAAQDGFSLLEQLGVLLEEQESDVLCVKCGNFVYLQVYPNNKKLLSS